MKKFRILLVATFITTVFNVTIVYGEVRPKAIDIPNKTIIIGTHIISLDVLNAETLKIAKESAVKNRYNVIQDKIYFKSDVNKGVWYDITDGGDITNISSTTSNLVSDSVIDALFLTHYTKANGQTVEFDTGKTVHVSDITGLNNPNNMEEFKSLIEELKIYKEFRNNLKVEDDDDEATERETLAEIWRYSCGIGNMEHVLSPILDATYNNMTVELDAFDSFISFLRSPKGAQSNVIELAIAEKMYLSTERDIYCYDQELKRLNDGSKWLSYIDYRWFSGLLEKYSLANTQIQSKILELQPGTKGSPSNSVEKVYHKYSNSMTELVKNRNFEGAYQELLKMNYVNNLQIEIIEDKVSEIKMATEARRIAFSKLRAAMNSGGSDAYKDAVRNGYNKDLLEKLKEDYVQECELYMNELNTIDAYILKRTDSAAEKSKVAQDAKASYEDLLDSLGETDFKESLQQSMGAELENATAKSKQLRLEASEAYMEAADEVENIKKEINALNESYIGAVEENQMDDANMHKAALDVCIANLKLAESRLEDISNKISQQESFAIGGQVVSDKTEIIEALDQLMGKLSQIEEGFVDDERIFSHKLEALQQALDENLKKFDDKPDSTERLEKLGDNVAGLKEEVDNLGRSAEGFENAMELLEDLVRQADVLQGQLNMADSELFTDIRIDIGNLDSAMAKEDFFEELQNIILDTVKGITGIRALPPIENATKECIEDESLSELLKEMANIDVTANGATKKIADLLKKITSLTKLQDLCQQSKALLKVIDAIESKISDMDNILMLESTGEQINEIKDSLDSTKRKVSVLSDKIHQASEDIAQELYQQLDRLKEEVQDIKTEFYAVADSTLNPDIELPPIEYLQEGDIASEENVPIIANHLALYTKGEKSKISEEMTVAEDEQKRAFIEPWHIIFTDYNVKLLKPIVWVGKDLYLPATELAKQMESDVIYEKAANRIVIKAKGVLIEFEQGSKSVYINDKKENISSEVFCLLGHYYLPLSCIEKAYRLADEDIGEYKIVSRK